VIDDDPNASELIAVSLQGLASRVLRASGGAEGIAAVRQDRPDVIVLDLLMPDVNGFDVVKSLSEQPDMSRIPIVVVTAKTVTAADRANLNGFVATVMEKTEFSQARFVAEVRRAMSGRKMAV